MRNKIQQQRLDSQKIGNEDTKMSSWMELLKRVSKEVAKELLRMAIEYAVEWAIEQYRKGQ